MIDPEHDLSIQKQAEVLDISRSSIYYQPRPVSESDLWLMRRIDQLHLDYPTSEAFTGRLKQEGIAISMDGKGRWRDNVFVKRVWRSIKYEEAYLHAYQSVSEARQAIGRYIEFYNTVRPHSSLKALTPDQVYFNRLPEPMAA
jgi:transposase InsO family protein